MTRPAPRFLRFSLVLAACAAVAGCGTVDGFSRRVASAVTPYKVEVVQGNFISREQVELLKPGMSRQQVRELLGTPLVTSLFHGDRWDYVFTLKRDGVQEQPRRLTVYFNGEALERFEGGDAMPSESEFVAAIGTKPRESRKPVLEASPEQLERAAAAGKRNGSAPERSATSPAAAPAAAASYPPLEPTVR